MNSFATYAWLITKDHLAEPGTAETDAGTTGPRAADPALLARLDAGEGHIFRLYDDDGEQYYTGRGIWTGDPTDPYEEACYGPLGDFGGPNAGCTEIRWHGKSHWDCG